MEGNADGLVNQASNPDTVNAVPWKEMLVD